MYEVAEFTEKPAAQQAAEYVASGHYLWNSNMFVWKAATVLELFARFEPEMHAGLQRIQAAVGTPEEEAVIAREYPKLKPISIDHALVERAPKVATLEADIAWGDIGSWAALTDVLPTDDAGNLLSGEVVALTRPVRRCTDRLTKSCCCWEWRIWWWWILKTRCWCARRMQLSR